MSGPSSLAALQEQTGVAWRALVEAAFGLTNAVNADAGVDQVSAAETALREAAIGFAEAHAALLAGLRPPAPRSRRR